MALSLKASPKENMKKEKKTIYLLDSKLKWKAFKALQDKIVKLSGPVPIHGDKAIWEMMRKKMIYCWFAGDMPNDMGIGLEIPPRYGKWELKIITNPTKK